MSAKSPEMDLEPSLRRANVVGCGLIGGSIGMALRDAGWHVSGVEADERTAGRAIDVGAIDVVGTDPRAAITFIATPVGAIPAAARAALEATAGPVSDVGGAKVGVVEAVHNPRFVGGHPMAGSEQLGIEGASPDLFRGAVWVLTPDESTDPHAYATVRAVVSELGADVIALAPAHHDELVAVVSHVPHLVAAALMRLASDRSRQHAALLRLAAGGFRDMTRIAAGSPAIWPDICAQNRQAICSVIDSLVDSLQELRATVGNSDREGLLEALNEAHAARRNLPVRAALPSAITEMRVPVPDRVGVLAEITTLATQVGVNIADLEIAHSSEGDAGVLILLVESERAEIFRERLAGLGYRPMLQPLE